MNPFPRAEAFLNLVLQQTVSATVLIAVVLLVQWLFRRQLTARWRFALWLVVLAALLLPVRPSSSYSLFNHVQTEFSIQGPRYDVPENQSGAALAGGPIIRPVENKIAVADYQVGNVPDVQLPEQTITAAAATSLVTTAVSEPPRSFWSRFFDIPGREVTWDDLVVPGFLAIWLLGVLALSLYVGRLVFRFRRQLSHHCTPISAAVQSVFNECRQIMQIRRDVELWETDAVKSPALYGLFRLRLLLPKGLAATFSPAELRHIFLHELAHVKRGDMWLNWLVTGLQIIHWFNPFIWLAFARLRADRELACDELALIHSGETEGQHYGQTILKLLENISQTKATPGLVGIVEDRKQMAQRLRRIAAFRSPSKWSRAAVLLVVGLGLVGLTGAQQPSPSSSEPVSKRKVPVEPKPSAKVAANLQFSINLTGKVLLPDGRPAAGSTVTTRGFGAANLFDFQKAETDNQGSFSVPEEKGVLFLMATHPLGFAQVKVEDFRTQPMIRLELWGRVEGALNMEPSSRKSGYLRLSPLLLAVANAPVMVRDFKFYSALDETGVYSFEKIPPGEYRVLWSQSPQGRSFGPPHIDTVFTQGALMGFVQVHAGKTGTIRTLPKGRTVKAKLTLPEHARGSDWSKLRVSGQLTSKLIQEIFKVSPMDFDDPHWKSDAYRNSLLNFRDYELKSSSDGVIVFEDLSPGEYFLSVSVTPAEMLERKATDDFIAVRHLGSIQLKTVVIPEPATGEPAVFDLGNLELVPSRR